MKTLTKASIMFVSVFLIFCCSDILIHSCFADIPHLINYQGKLTDKDNKPVIDGTYPVTFRIYDSETAGSLLWEETQSITAQKGVFSVLLGGVTNLDLSFDKPYFLEIKVKDEVLSPRQRIASVGYAYRAENANQAQNATTVDAIGVSTTPAANKILPLDSNAKLSASVLKIYDSGWFSVANGGAYSTDTCISNRNMIYWFHETTWNPDRA